MTINGRSGAKSGDHTHPWAKPSVQAVGRSRSAGEVAGKPAWPSLCQIESLNSCIRLGSACADRWGGPCVLNRLYEQRTHSLAG
jgi:hypothetical protein